jgi:hypothetical protein
MNVKFNGPCPLLYTSPLTSQFLEDVQVIVDLRVIKFPSFGRPEHLPATAVTILWLDTPEQCMVFLSFVWMVPTHCPSSLLRRWSDALAWNRGQLLVPVMQKVYNRTQGCLTQGLWPVLPPTSILSICVLHRTSFSFDCVMHSLRQL